MEVTAIGVAVGAVRALGSRHLRGARRLQNTGRRRVFLTHSPATGEGLVMRIMILALVAWLAGCAGLSQTEDEVFLRETGGTLHAWLTRQDASSRHWPYAWASVAAYQDKDDPKRHRLDTKNCPDPNSLLVAQKWELWKDLPQLEPKQTSTDAGEMYDVHLRAQVWANKEQGLVIVAFGGTAFTSWEDWKSNMRWLIDPFTDPKDAYSVLSKNFIPLFVDMYKEKRRAPGGEWLATAEVVAAGHSLGGGLAQRFAYALKADEGVPVVKTVYAFNPSPVSGKRGVPSWEENAKGLTIYRIYNRGEFLATVRSMLSWAAGDGDGQTWLDIRYLDNWKWTSAVTGTVHAHQMFMLACFMKEGALIPDPPPPQ